MKTELIENIDERQIHSHIKEVQFSSETTVRLILLLRTICDDLDYPNYHVIHSYVGAEISIFMRFLTYCFHSKFKALAFQQIHRFESDYLPEESKLIERSLNVGFIHYKTGNTTIISNTELVAFAQGLMTFLNSTDTFFDLKAHLESELKPILDTKEENYRLVVLLDSLWVGHFRSVFNIFRVHVLIGEMYAFDGRIQFVLHSTMSENQDEFELALHKLENKSRTKIYLPIRKP